MARNGGVVEITLPRGRFLCRALRTVRLSSEGQSSGPGRDSSRYRLARGIGADSPADAVTGLAQVHLPRGEVVAGGLILGIHASKSRGDHSSGALWARPHHPRREPRWLGPGPSVRWDARQWPRRPGETTGGQCRLVARHTHRPHTRPGEAAEPRTRVWGSHCMPGGP